MKNDVMWSSKKMDWSTPQDFFDKLNEEFHFTLDPCADILNHKSLEGIPGVQRIIGYTEGVR